MPKQTQISLLCLEIIVGARRCLVGPEPAGETGKTNSWGQSYCGSDATGTRWGWSVSEEGWCTSEVHCAQCTVHSTPHSGQCTVQCTVNSAQQRLAPGVPSRRSGVPSTGDDAPVSRGHFGPLVCWCWCWCWCAPWYPGAHHGSLVHTIVHCTHCTQLHHFSPCHPPCHGQTCNLPQKQTDTNFAPVLLAQSST